MLQRLVHVIAAVRIPALALRAAEFEHRPIFYRPATVMLGKLHQRQPPRLGLARWPHRFKHGRLLLRDEYRTPRPRLLGLARHRLLAPLQSYPVDLAEHRHARDADAELARDLLRRVALGPQPLELLHLVVCPRRECRWHWIPTACQSPACGRAGSDRARLGWSSC